MLGSIPIEIKPERLVRKIRNGSKKSITRRTKREIEKAINEINSCAKAKAMYKTLPLTDDNGLTIPDGELNIKSKKIRKVFDPCDKAAVFLVTLGEEADKLIADNIKKRPHYGFILDAAASIAIESAAEYLEKTITKKLTNGARATMRYSPGYCDWSIAEQKKLFSLLPYKKLDVKLSDDCLMSPRKSISGIIGICPDASNDFTGNACRDCSRENCPYKRENRN